MLTKEIACCIAKCPTLTYQPKASRAPQEQTGVLEGWPVEDDLRYSLINGKRSSLSCYQMRR